MDDNTKRIEPSAKRMPRIIQDDQWVSVESSTTPSAGG